MLRVACLLLRISIATASLSISIIRNLTTISVAPGSIGIPRVEKAQIRGQLRHLRFESCNVPTLQLAGVHVWTTSSLKHSLLNLQPF